MITLLHLFSFYLAAPAIKTFRLMAPQKELVLRTQDDEMGMIARSAYVDNRLVLLNESPLTFWVINLETNSFLVFGEQGEGPGELAKDLRGLWLHEGLINITHRNGFRWDQFDMAGQLVRQETIPGAQELWFTKDTCTLVRDPNTFSIQSKTASTETPLFPEDQYGRDFEVATFQDFLLLITRQANNDKIAIKVINTRTGTLVKDTTFDKKLLNHTDGLPLEHQRKLKAMGFSPDNLFARSITSVISHPDWGFLFPEFSIHDRSSPEHHFSVVHRYDPRTDQHEMWKINHPGMTSLYFFLPKTLNLWLIHDLKNETLIWIKVKQETAG